MPKRGAGPAAAAASSKRAKVSAALGAWALRCVGRAREALAAGTAGAGLAALEQLVAVLRRLPSLWGELSGDLLRALWQAADAGLRARLAEGAAGALVLGPSALQAGTAAPAHLPGFLKLLGEALAEDGRHRAAWRALGWAADAARAAGDAAAEDEVLEGLERLRARALASWHFHMVNDAGRNAAFAAAIATALRELQERPGRGGRGAVCLDVGTGTGLLALACARLGGERVRSIHACEMNDVLFALAREIVSEHGHLDEHPDAAAAIRLQPIKSTSLVLDEPADLLFSEIFDDTLLGEGFLPMLLDARARLLKPDAIVIPRRVTLHGMLINCPSLPQRFGVHCPPCGLDFTTVPVKARSEYVCEELALLPHTPLCPPTPLLRLDFADVTELRRLLEQRHLPPVALTPARAGCAHALAVWWELELDAAGQHRLSSAPGRAGNHWKQVLWPLRPPGRGSTSACGREVRDGERLRVRPCLSEEAVEWDLVAEEEEEEEEEQEWRRRPPKPLAEPDEALLLSQEDLEQLGSSERWAVVDAAVAEALQQLAGGKTEQDRMQVHLIDISRGPLPVPMVLALRRLLQQEEAPPSIEPLASASCLLREASAARPAAAALLAANLPAGAARRVELLQGRERGHGLRQCRGEAPLPQALGPAEAGLLLLCGSMLRSGGELHHEVLEELAAVQLRCQRRPPLRQLLVVPASLHLWLTPIESPELARRSRVIWGGELSADGGEEDGGLPGLGLDVRALDALGAASFQGLGEGALRPRRLSEAKEALSLPLGPELPRLLESLASKPRRLCLGPLQESGRLHGVVSRWAWPGEQVGRPGPEALAGVVWPKLGVEERRAAHGENSTGAAAGGVAVGAGDSVLLELRYSPLRGMLLTPLRIARASRRAARAGQERREAGQRVEERADAEDGVEEQQLQEEDEESEEDDSKQSVEEDSEEEEPASEDERFRRGAEEEEEEEEEEEMEEEEEDEEEKDDPAQGVLELL